MKLVTVTLNASEAISIESSNTVYVGDIDSDDYESADFSIVPRNAAGDITLPLHIEFLDANNERYEMDTTVSIHLYTQEEAQSKGIIQSSNYVGYIITAIIVIGGFLLYRRMRKKRE